MSRSLRHEPNYERKAKKALQGAKHKKWLPSREQMQILEELRYEHFKMRNAESLITPAI